VATVHELAQGEPRHYRAAPWQRIQHRYLLGGAIAVGGVLTVNSCIKFRL
jgi:hypothetical protein